LASHLFTFLQTSRLPFGFQSGDLRPIMRRQTTDMPQYRHGIHKSKLLMLFD
jgi:hypothetical protein